ncbi:MAG: signal peptidase II [Acidobacteria bacterium]|nr:signal peptidase II [Acidobacteriota bacterium]
MLRNTPLRTRRLALAVAAAVIVVDQLTKWWVVATLPGKPVVLVDGFLQLRFVSNSGAAFSLLDGFGSVIGLVAIAAAVFIFVVAVRVNSTGETVALGLVLGGAIGNLADRAFRGDGFLDGGVVDFVDFSFFPAFNAADSAITIGAVLALWFAFVDR